MRITRIITAAIGASLLAAGLVGDPAAAVAWNGWCDTAAGPDLAKPCIEEVSRAGTPITAADHTYGVSVFGFMQDGTYTVNWWITGRGLGGSLPAADLAVTFSITVNLRGKVPRFSFAHADAEPGDVERTKSGPDHLITVAGRPVTITQGCDGAGVCPRVAESDRAAYLDGWIYDPVWYADSGVEPVDWNGSDMWTNIDWTEFPPQVRDGALRLNVANSHFRAAPLDAVPVTGFLRQRLPYRMVRTVLFIDDPATLTGSGVIGTLAGTGAGTVGITNNPVAEALDVSAEGISFSKRAIVLRQGVITPRRGVVTAATRIAPHKVTVGWRHGVARGSSLRGYQVRVYARVDGQRRAVVTAYFAGAAVVRGTLRGVGSGARWAEVRVKSRAGYGPWSRAVRVGR